MGRDAGRAAVSVVCARFLAVYHNWILHLRIALRNLNHVCDSANNLSLSL